MKNLFKGIIMSALLVISITVRAQDLALNTQSSNWTEKELHEAALSMSREDSIRNTKPSKVEILIADETTVIYGDKTFRVICSNEVLQKRLLLKPFKSCLISNKKDRNGKYHQYSFVFENILKSDILESLK